jgi:hypothetical protein
MSSKLSQLLDASLSHFPINSNPSVNNLANAVHEHSGKYIKINVVFLVLVLAVIVPEILVVKQVVLVSLVSVSKANLYLRQV